MVVGEPSSLPTHMWVAELVTELQVLHVGLVDPHIHSAESSSYCMREGAVDGGVPHVDVGILMTPLTPHLSASSANDRPV